MIDSIKNLFSSEGLLLLNNLIKSELENSIETLITRECIVKKLGVELVEKISPQARFELEKNKEEYKIFKEKEAYGNACLTLISTIISLGLIPEFKWQAGVKPGIISINKNPEKLSKKKEISQNFINHVFSFLKENYVQGRAITKRAVVDGLVEKSLIEDSISALNDLSYLIGNDLLPGWKGKQGRNGGIVRDE